MITMKRFIKEILIVCILLSLSFCVSIEVHAETILNKGDCVVYGHISGEKMTWRVYDKTADSVILISDRVINHMAYDEDNSLWDTSDIRQWLNSENGFLSLEYFTETELGLMSFSSRYSLTNKSLLDVEYAGVDEHIYNSSFGTMLQNYDSSYKISSSDKVFLPNIADISAINLDPYTFGVDYAMTDSVYEEGAYCKYWLSDGMYGLAQNLVRCITTDGRAGYEYSDAETLGVRPMCSLASSKIGIASGEGTEDLPYVLGDDDYLAISLDNSALWTGSKCKVSVYGKGTAENCVVLYQNGKKISDNAADGVEAEVVDGVNVFTAYVYDESGKPVLMSAPAEVWGLSYNVTKTKLECDFESENSLTSQSSLPNVYWSESYGKNGKGICLVSKPKTQAAISNITFDKAKTAVLMTVDLKFDTFGVLANSPFRIKAMPQDEFLMPVSVDAKGYLTLSGVNESSGTLAKLSEDTWYNFKLIINDVDNTLSLALDNVVLCRDVKLSTEFDYSAYAILSASWNNTDKENIVCIDNLYVHNIKPLEREATLTHIIHPDKKTISSLYINSTIRESDGIMLGAKYENFKLSELLTSSVYLSGESSCVWNFEFDTPLESLSHIKTFVFNNTDQIKPIVRNSK